MSAAAAEESGAARPRIIYLHGFNSSPQSAKARQLGEVFARRGEPECYACPALPVLPDGAIAVAETEIPRARTQRAVVTLVGSSLGGFYATWLAERHDCHAVLINPAITPHAGLRAYLGPQRNLHTGEAYTLTEQHLAQRQRLFVPVLTPSRYLLLVETGDEVLDYQAAVARYAGARQVVVQGATRPSGVSSRRCLASSRSPAARREIARRGRAHARCGVARGL